MSLFSPTGVKHRLFLFFYWTCLGFSLVPTLVAPPERSFAQGQPEMQQAKDNMLVRERMIKKRMEFPALGDVAGYPELLTFKTSQLLSEAEHMLNRVKNVRERRWVEAFVHRLKLLVIVLEQSVSTRQTSKNATAQESEELSHAIPVPENRSLPSMHALNEPVVPESRRKQDDIKITSKYPVTIPQLNRVLPVPAERQVATKPALTLSMVDKKLDMETERDELVRELEDLPKIAASEHLRPAVTAPKLELKEVEKKIPVESSPIPPKRMGPMNSVIENEKTRIKEHLVQEVAALHRLGETKENIMDALSYENPNVNDLTSPKLMLEEQPNLEGGISKVDRGSFPLSNAKIAQREETLIADESIISPSTPNIWRPMTAIHPATHTPKQYYMNNSFQEMHISLPPMKQQVLTRHIQNSLLNDPSRPLTLPTQHDGIKDTIQRLQRQHQNFLIKNHILEIPQAPNMKHNMFVPVHAKQGHLFPPNSKYLGDPSLGMYRPDHGSKHIYTPYPYFQNSDHKNLAFQGMAKPVPNHPIGTNLSDEMNRELRDGKVILLSDNVIRSNFEPEAEKNVNESPIQAVIPGKNETSAQE